jgi:TetR/AcrR family transcriptional regulator, lmrAB and yxaGH operons repressor
VVAKGDVRARMVASAVRLLAERGMEGTSFADVLAASGASRGSTYHHFPDGKSELVAAALTVAGDNAMAAMEPARGRPAPAVVRRFFSLWRHLLAATDLRAGCAVLAVTVAAGDDELLTQAGRVFRAWRDHLAELLHVGGLSDEGARRLATLTIAASEGAVALARAERDWAPFDLVESQLVAQAEQALQG